VFLSQASRVEPLGRCLTLGRQHLFIEPHLMRWASRMTGIPLTYLRQHNGTFADQLLFDYFRATQLSSIDLLQDDQPTIQHDLNTPVPSSIHGLFDTVLDIGTSEHVFSLETVLDNIRNLWSRRGFILHYVPSNNMSGHGLYQFSPTLFQSVYQSSISKGRASVYACFQNKETTFFLINFKPSLRININFWGAMNLFVVITDHSLTSPSDIQQLDYQSQSPVSEHNLISPDHTKKTLLRYKLIQYLKPLTSLYTSKILVSRFRSCHFYQQLIYRYQFHKFSRPLPLPDLEMLFK